MPDSSSSENDFLTRVNRVIEENLSDERFGVSELAREMGMSRSNLLRKLKKLTDLSVSRYIRHRRLEKGMELLRNSDYTVSEVSFRVGFNSTSYFIKCFHEHYGYPPGEAGKHAVEDKSPEKAQVGRKGKRGFILAGTAILVIAVVLILVIINPFSAGRADLEKSIAVLPFKNDSNDSTNVYLINGLMEAILVNLQQIEDLRVISRTSVEKYRNNTSTIPEIAMELNANYVVEGSGQKIGNQILLNIQLIEAHSDNHLWAGSYDREVTDIFSL